MGISTGTTLQDNYRWNFKKTLQDSIINI
jgi:hypothetical protein